MEYVGEARQNDSIVRNVLQGSVQLVFISPETILHNHKFRTMLLLDVYRNRLVALVVDEAHCIKTW